MAIIRMLIFILFIYYGWLSLNKTRYIIVLCGLNYIVNCLGHFWGLKTLIPLGGISLLCSDYVVIIMIMILLLRRKSVETRESLFVLLWMIVFLLLSVRGFVSKQSTFVEWIAEVRKWLYFIIPIYFFTKTATDYSISWIYKKLKPVFNFVAIYCVLFWFCALVLRVNITAGALGRESLRCLAANEALIFALYTLVLIYQDLCLEKGTYLKRKTLLFTFISIFLRHNSVWLGLFVGIIAICLYGNIKIWKSKRFVQQMLCMILLLSGILVFFSDSTIVSSILETSEKFEDLSTGTTETRFTMWIEHIKSMSGMQYVIGKPIGSGFRMYYRNAVWNVQPHNCYVECFVHQGAIGAGLLLWYLIKKIITDMKIGNRLSVVIVLAMMTFFMAYGQRIECGEILGLLTVLRYSKRDVAIEQKGKI